MMMATRQWYWPWRGARQRDHAESAAVVTPLAAQPESDVLAVARSTRDRRLATILTSDELVWLLGEQYDAEHETWTIDLLRADSRHGWRRQRYKYDAATDVLYFWGERPVAAAEVRSLNLRAIPRFRPQPAPSPAAQPAPTATAGAAPPAPVHTWEAPLPQASGAA